MECYITYCIGGFLAFDENNNLISLKAFPKDERISKFISIENKKLTSEEEDLINEIGNDFDFIIIETTKRKSDYSKNEFYEKIQIEVPNNGGEHLRKNLEEYLTDLDFDNKEEYVKTYRELALFKMKETSKSEDKHLIQAINSIDEIDESISKLIERIREWYALYFPEMDNIRNNETYIKLISENKTKEEIIKVKPDAFLEDVDDEEINPDDLDIINTFANSIYTLQKTRKATEDYIESKMESIAPNLRILVGSSLGAKLISHAGGIKRLATYPSSTVQIMGAEKALFRHLKSGDNPPKYGLIYQHPDVRGSKWWNRGKIARLLASRISLAVRKDVFGNDVDLDIYDKFIEKANEIEKENPFPKTSNQRKTSKNAPKKRKSRKKKKRRRK